MNRRMLLVVILALLVGIGFGYWFRTERIEEQVSTGPEMSRTERKPLFYRDPMNPEVTSPVPRKDAMGMDFIPIYPEELQKEGPPGTVVIDPVTVQNIGVRTARVERQTLSRTVRSVGRVTYDEELITRLHPKVEGWVTKLYVDQTGEQVKRNQELLQIYSPQLVATQQEYLLALNNLEILRDSPFKDIRQGGEELVKGTLERLQLLDVPAHQIRALEETRKVEIGLHIHSPSDGVVVNIGAREGSYVTPQTELYRLADLSKIWVYVDVYEYEIPWVRLGDSAEMQLAALPGQIIRGKITYVYPYLEPKTRTLKVRLEFANPNMRLKPDMYANVTIHASRQVKALVIPEEAVIMTGTRNVTFVVRAPGKFEPRDVTLGVRSGGLVQVLDGLSAGEEVVASGEFLIDSESSLREAAAKMMPLQGQEQPPHSPMHGDHP